MTQVVLAQKVSWAAALATPPAESGAMLVVALSDPRWTYHGSAGEPGCTFRPTEINASLTWYNEPE